MNGYHDEELTWTCDKCGEICDENTYPTMVTLTTGQVLKAEDGRVIDLEPQFPIETEQLCYTCFEEKYKSNSCPALGTEHQCPKIGTDEECLINEQLCSFRRITEAPI